MLSATPELYRKNAFRLTGLSVESGARELLRFGERLEMLHRLNGRVESVKGGFPLKPFPSHEEVRDALQRLRDPEQRLFDEFFWFWPVSWGNTTQDQALTALDAGQVDVAVASWRELLGAPAHRGAALHNLALVEHLKAVEPAGTTTSLRATWRLAFRRWAELLLDESIWNNLLARIKALDDPRVTPVYAREFRTALPAALLSLNAALARRAAEAGDAQAAAFQAAMIRESGFDRYVIAMAMKRLVDPEATRISGFCETALARGNSNPSDGAKAASRLLEETRPLLDSLDRLLDEGETRREELHDEVASTALSCLVKYANSTEDWETVLPLTEALEKTAVSPAVRTRVAENLEAVKGNLRYGTCWFCKIRRSEPPAVYKIPMYGEVEREYRFLQGTQVRWRKHAVEVPRCSTCAAAHASVRKSGTVGGVLGALIGWGGCVSVQGENGLIAILFFAGSIALGHWVGKRLAWKKAPSGIAGEKSGRQFPAVLEFKRIGWQFGDKP